MNPRTAAPLLLLLLLPASCGPMTFPAVQRLKPDEQAEVDGMWNNMLSPPDRLDRSLLLDTMLTFELHQLGADRVRFQSEKDWSGGTVTMDVRYDRRKPSGDSFAVRVLDRKGHLIRAETYSGEEVLARVTYLMQAPATQPSKAIAVGGNSPKDAEFARKEREARGYQILAATQPAQ